MLDLQERTNTNLAYKHGAVISETANREDKFTKRQTTTPHNKLTAIWCQILPQHQTNTDKENNVMGVSYFRAIYHALVQLQK